MNQDIEYNINQHQHLTNQFEEDGFMFRDKISRKEDMKKNEIEKMNEERSQELRELRSRIDELNNELNPYRPNHVSNLQCHT